jgi:hypothetical protein
MIRNQSNEDININTEVFKSAPLPELKEGEAMVLGSKVNYEDMTKEKSQENLNSILNAAFEFLPPPPPPPPPK